MNFYLIGGTGNVGISEYTYLDGIRFADGNIGDQVRVMTPAQARIEGSDYIVVGRPITQADNPVEAYHRCKKIKDNKCSQDYLIKF